MRFRALVLTLLVGLQASAAPAVSPFFLFFDSGTTKWSGYGDVVLDNVVERVRAHRIPRLIVAAHTDRAGSSGDNLLLSRRRAEAVRDALIRRGLGHVTFEIEAYGEDRPLVETPDGAAEPQNRRAEIVIGCIPNPVGGFEYMRC